MGARRSGREAALQMLFQLEASAVSADQTVSLFWRTFEDADPEGRAYADAIVHGVADHLPEIDKKITSASQNWRLERMSRVDRNLLRLGTWELMFKKDVPRAVIIDEAVELAKSFGTDESSGFVNGVLDRIASDLGRTDAR
ncbi:Transcription termination protein NusB [Labilithrix luteola]|uniref:Transcription antitermination protein NusB n=1 Tax=Labilithrix luteola TaxID=1391654 RepID=A0A0K1Q3Q8_9BACT|nr:transcription antitermination factor NusB [Labilithrix luteola]AKV00025.1 Transcription termination protein NusB [Labilithrix luteola]